MKKSRKAGSRRRFWARHVAAWRRGGLTRAAYAREYGFNPETFSRWVRLLGFGEKSEPEAPLESSKEEFAPVQFVSIPEELVTRAAHSLQPQRTTEISVVVAHRYRVIVPDGFARATLSDIVRTLESLG